MINPKAMSGGRSSAIHTSNWAASESCKLNPFLDFVNVANQHQVGPGKPVTVSMELLYTPLTVYRGKFTPSYIPV